MKVNAEKDSGPSEYALHLDELVPARLACVCFDAACQRHELRSGTTDANGGVAIPPIVRELIEKGPARRYQLNEHAPFLLPDPLLECLTSLMAALLPGAYVGRKQRSSRYDATGHYGGESNGVGHKGTIAPVSDRRHTN